MQSRSLDIDLDSVRVLACMVRQEILSLCNRKNAIFVILCAIVIYVHLIAKSDDEIECHIDEKESRCREDEVLRFLIDPCNYAEGVPRARAHRIRG